MNENEELMYLLACMQAALLKQAGFKDLEKAAELFNDAMSEDLADDVSTAASEFLAIIDKLKEQNPDL